MDCLNCILIVLLFDIVVDKLVLRIFKVSYNIWWLMFLQIPKICASIICCIYFEFVYIGITARIVSMVVCVVFIIDSFNLKKLAGVFFSEIALWFSLGGFLNFLTICLESSIERLFLQKIPENCQILLYLALILYIFAIFSVVKFLEKNKFLKNFLMKVSFKINEKHISMYGLIDSGNSLFDTLTRKPVVLVSVDSLKKYFSDDELFNLIELKSRKIRCDTISGSGFEIPILKVKDFCLCSSRDFKNINCMIGVVDKRFEKGKIDCLLHRDFL